MIIQAPSLETARKLVPITPNDVTELGTFDLRALWVGAGGDVAVIARDDSAPVTISNVPDGTPLPISVKRVMATGTTARGIIGLA